MGKAHFILHLVLFEYADFDSDVNVFFLELEVYFLNKFGPKI